MNFDLPPVIRERIRAAIVSGNKIEAIRMLRETRPELGLAEAKDIVEHWDSPSTSPAPDGASSTEIDQAIFRDEKILAIKLHRETYGDGLANAKKAVEQRERELRQNHPERFGPQRAKGCLTVVAMLAVVIALLKLV